ncbi:MAG: GNAT family N-acetyltransferase [Acidobacteriia bacterium]|nr:GNAT family N-acetyltransferase [Terriglobia bacterium]
MIGLLQPEHTGRYADLTFPSYRAALHSAESIIAVSASVGGAAAGLGLARIDGDVLSIAVRDAHRRQGIGRALLARLEEELSAAGARAATCTYMTENPSTEAVEKILRARNWETPVERMLVCRAPIAPVKKASWVQTAASLDVVPWEEVPRAGRAAFDSSEGFEPANSLGVRIGGGLAGCVVTHRIARSLLRYTKLAMRPGLEKSGIGLALLAEAIRRHPNDTNEEEEAGIWDVRMDNRLMLNLVRRRLQPYLTRVSKTMGSRKLL